jgi:hypothetical protein
VSDLFDFLSVYNSQKSFIPVTRVEKPLISMSSFQSESLIFASVIELNEVEDGSVSKVFSSFEFFCSDDNFMSFMHFAPHSCSQVCSRFLISLSEKNYPLHVNCIFK